MNERNEIRGGDPVRAALCRWTLDRLNKHSDLIDRLRREEYELAWGALKGRRARIALLRALELHPEIQTELSLRSGLLRVLPKAGEEVKA